MHSRNSFLLALGLLCSTVSAAVRNYKNVLTVTVSNSDDVHVDVTESSNATLGMAYFKTFLDHNNKSAGTFNIRYWYNSQYYVGAGSPVLVFSGQEADASLYQAGFLSNKSVLNALGRGINGAIIVLEHRYYGDSSPYSVLSDQNLTYLTLEQNIADINHFAQTVTLPFDKKRTSSPDKVPWLLYGVSYSGAVSAWVAATAPGTYWGYFASSAVVETISNFWQYFAPEQEHMAKNCSADISRVVEYVDNVISFGTKKELKALQAMFGLEKLQFAIDFADTIPTGLYLWQAGDITNNEQFLNFCDYVENANGPNATIPGAKGVGLAKALKGYATWFSTIALPGACESYGYEEFQGELNTECYNTHNATSPIYTDLTVGNPVNRQWFWMLCNQPFGYWQTGAPLNITTLVSRTVDVNYWTRQCKLFFPSLSYGIAEGKSVNSVNKFTGGWFIDNIPRLFYITGGNDPWRDATVSSDFRPGGRLQSNENTHVGFIPDGFHGSDIRLKNAENKGARKVQNDMVAFAQKYVKEFKPS